MTSRECLRKAAEAEELAKLVSLRTDKDRLWRSAEAWRQRAREAPVQQPER